MMTSNVYHLKGFLTSFVLLLCLGLFAQGKSSKMNLQKQMQFVTPAENVKAEDFFSQTLRKMDLGSNDEMVLTMELLYVIILSNFISTSTSSHQ